MIPFEMGQVVMTAGVSTYLKEHSLYNSIMSSLAKHHSGDWGDMCDEDKASNDAAVNNGSRIFSAYMLGTEKIWVITESDRSSTTVLFPSEY